MRIDNTDRTRAYRLGNKVFRLSHGTWRMCLENGVDDHDVAYHSARYSAMNVPHNKEVAALRALEDKLVRKGGYGK